eukprot:6208554-Pleurochrysis_carterae.AAC.2
MVMIKILSGAPVPGTLSAEISNLPSRKCVNSTRRQSDHSGRSAVERCLERAGERLAASACKSSAGLGAIPKVVLLGHQGVRPGGSESLFRAASVATHSC